MSWTDVFPVLPSEMVTEYQACVTQDDRAQYAEWFGIDRIIPPKRTRSTRLRTSASTSRNRTLHVVSATLFWKHVQATDPDLPIPSRKRLVMARQLGLVKRFAPWESYVQPLLIHTRQAVTSHPEISFRLYLAQDLQFLVSDLVALGWEVYLMRSPSLRYCPGGFWRFLALEDRNTIVTVIDTDRMGDIDGEIARTNLMHEKKLGFWRVPGYYSVDNDATVDQVRYRPMLGGHFGGRAGLPVRLLIEAFVWHSRRGTLPATARLPGRNALPINAIKWPDYGFDEWFQLAALYPRMARRGTLTFVPHNAFSLLLPLDIEYVTWANSRSELIYFG